MIKTYGKPEIDRKEVARYLGYGKHAPDEAVCAMIEQEIGALQTECRVCWTTLPAMADANGVDFGCFRAESTALAKYIGTAQEAVLFGATIGIGFDRLLKREMIASPARGTVLQAVGAAAIEALCDTFCAEFDAPARFSPGYGDLSLSVQKDIFRVLNLEKAAGITLTDSLLMTPTKSVTALFVPGRAECKSGCGSCDKDCFYRKAEE